MRYFVRGLGGEASILFRVLPEVAVEVYDVTAHAWRARDLELGVEEVSAQEATELIHEFEFGRDAGRRRGPDRVRGSQ